MDQRRQMMDRSGNLATHRPTVLGRNTRPIAYVSRLLHTETRDNIVYIGCLGTGGRGWQHEQGQADAERIKIMRSVQATKYLLCKDKDN